jgi:hypothetical protein
MRYARQNPSFDSCHLKVRLLSRLVVSAVRLGLDPPTESTVQGNIIFSDICGADLQLGWEI